MPKDKITYDPVLISIIRQSYPTLIANSIIGAQDMLNLDIHVVETKSSNNEHWVRLGGPLIPRPVSDWCKEVGIEYHYSSDKESFGKKIEFENAEALNMFLMRWGG